MTWSQGILIAAGATLAICAAIVAQEIQLETEESTVEAGEETASTSRRSLEREYHPPQAP
ncbi:MAG: hypothetical protein LC685_03690 [Actinobacteria bacterium]|nr:hypothetical protein [Actinomycetota bacterium]